MIDIDRLAESYWAYRDPAYREGKVICEWCGCSCDEEEAVAIGRFETVCPDCIDEVKADEIDWAKRHGIDPLSIEGIYEDDLD